METQTLERVDTTVTNDDDLDHLYCCDKDVALCGYDLTDAVDIESDVSESMNLCVLCNLTEICPLCGLDKKDL